MTMSTRQMARPDTHRLPRDIASPQAKLVYHSLDAAVSASVDELADRLSLKKITLLDVLSSLEKRGYVESRKGRYDCC